MQGKDLDLCHFYNGTDVLKLPYQGRKSGESACGVTGGLVSEPQCPHRKPNIAGYTTVPTLRRQRQGEPWGSPARQPSQILIGLTLKTKVDERQSRLAFGLHVQASTDMDTCMYTHIPCAHTNLHAILSLTYNISWFLTEAQILSAICGGGEHL